MLQQAVTSSGDSQLARSIMQVTALIPRRAPSPPLAALLNPQVICLPGFREGMCQPQRNCCCFPALSVAGRHVMSQR